MLGHLDVDPRMADAAKVVAVTIGSPVIMLVTQREDDAPFVSYTHHYSSIRIELAQYTSTNCELAPIRWASQSLRSYVWPSLMTGPV